MKGKDQQTKIVDVIQNVTLLQIRKQDGAMLFTWQKPNNHGDTQIWLCGWNRPCNVKVGDKGHLELRSRPNWLLHFFVKEESQLEKYICPECGGYMEYHESICVSCYTQVRVNAGEIEAKDIL